MMRHFLKSARRLQVVLEVIEEQVARGSRIYEAGAPISFWSMLKHEHSLCLRIAPPLLQRFAGGCRAACKHSPVGCSSG